MNESVFGRVGVRWTVGDVSERGFEALRLSILGARRVFGGAARYAVCVNTISPANAQARVGDAASLVEWRRSDGAIPPFLLDRLSPGLAEGVAWKLAPLRIFPERFEIALDNDCIFWGMPDAVMDWLNGVGRAACLLAEDVLPCFGGFAPLCGPEPRNTGIRGLPPGFDLEHALRHALSRLPGVPIAGEVDEQGLQVAALSTGSVPKVVTVAEVTICSPFPPHVPHLGRCGAHFVGVNMRRPRPEHGCDQAMLDRLAAHWDGLRPELANLVQG